MTASNPKTKRDRAAGRHHRHTAIQTIVNNHEGIIDDIARIDISIAELHNTTCYLGTRFTVWTDRLEEQNDYTRQNVAHAMQRVARNERKQAEVECAVGILQGAGKDQRKALAQLDRYTKRLHAKQTSQNHDITITRADLAIVRAQLAEMEKKLITLAWISLALWVAAALTIFILLII
ncbi:hypothetical protein [Rothia mucilaginosa]